MTINEAIEMVDRLKPNQYEHEQKVGWLSKLDGMIYEEIRKILQHRLQECTMYPTHMQSKHLQDMSVSTEDSSLKPFASMKYF